MTPEIFQAMLDNNLSKYTEKLEDLKITLNNSMGKITTRVNNFEKEMDSMTRRVDVIEDKVQGMNSELNTILSRKDSYNEVDNVKLMRELAERQWRKKNLIFVGIQEEGLMKDKEKVDEIVNALIPDQHPLSIMTFRIGKKLSQMQNQIRPIRVVFQNEVQATAVHAAYVKMKRYQKTNQQHATGMTVPSCIPLTLGVNFDKTPAQMDQLQAVKREFQLRQEKGEMNIRIAFRGDYPIIVRSNLERNK